MGRTGRGIAGAGSTAAKREVWHAVVRLHSHEVKAVVYHCIICIDNQIDAQALHLRHTETVQKQRACWAKMRSCRKRQSCWHIPTAMLASAAPLCPLTRTMRLMEEAMKRRL